MTNKDVTVINGKSVKALVDRTDWQKVYSQSEQSIEVNIMADPDAAYLKNSVYRKVAKAVKK